MRIKPVFQIHDVGSARALVRGRPFVTIVTADLQATHMPCLVDEDGDDLAILAHVARTDPAAAGLGGPVLAVFHGPAGYVSASWYRSDIISTWNHVTLHIRGTPELFEDSMPVLRRTVDHFEAAVERPWSLDRLGESARRMADKVVAFRLRRQLAPPGRLSQDKPAEERAGVLAGLGGHGAYANPELAAAMRETVS